MVAVKSAVLRESATCADKCFHAHPLRALRTKNRLLLQASTLRVPLPSLSISELLNIKTGNDASKCGRNACCRECVQSFPPGAAGDHFETFDAQLRRQDLELDLLHLGLSRMHNLMNPALAKRTTEKWKRWSASSNAIRKPRALVLVL
jgi:hypothetical protein